MPHLVILAILLAAFLASACSVARPSEAPAPGQQDQPAAGALRSESMATDSSARATGASLPATSGGRAVSAMAEASIPPLDRMVIANVSLSLSVENAVDAARLAERTAERYGGFVAGSSIRDNDTAREASVTVRVPSARLSEALSELRGIGRRVTDESRTTQDVTEEFTDLESNVRNLRSTETQVLALMERATKIEEIMALQRELTGIRGQVERLEGRRRVLENRADFATIAMKLVETAAPGTRDGWNALATATQALTSLGRFAENLGTVLIWLLAFLPVYGPVFAAAWWLGRRWRAAPTPAASPAPQA